MIRWKMNTIINAVFDYLNKIKLSLSSRNQQHHSFLRTCTMASGTLPQLLQLNPTPFALGNLRVLNKQGHKRILSPSLYQSRCVLLIQSSLRIKSNRVSCAYVAGPASDSIVSEHEPSIEEPKPQRQNSQLASLISWGLLWNLLAKHKMRLGVSVLALFGCTACTLSMPIFSGI